MFYYYLLICFSRKTDLIVCVYYRNYSFFLTDFKTFKRIKEVPLVNHLRLNYVPNNFILFLLRRCKFKGVLVCLMLRNNSDIFVQAVTIIDLGDSEDKEAQKKIT